MDSSREHYRRPFLETLVRSCGKHIYGQRSTHLIPELFTNLRNQKWSRGDKGCLLVSHREPEIWPGRDSFVSGESYLTVYLCLHVSALSSVSVHGLKQLKQLCEGVGIAMGEVAGVSGMGKFLGRSSKQVRREGDYDIGRIKKS